MAFSKLTERGVVPRLLFFTLLLGLSTVAPVVAAPTEAPTEAEVAAALDAGFAAYREQQRRREEQLSAPAAIQEREASRYAFSELTPAAAEELLRSRFGEVLEALDKDPSRYLSDAKLERPLGPDAATVTSEGETTLLESSVPVRAPDEDGDLSKVDLSLIRTPEGWEPVNPLVDLEIGESAEEGIEVGDGGLSVTQVGAGESVARPLGDENIFYGEVSAAAADTDLLVSPTSSGVELFNLLRSADSPETLRFHIDMPSGSSLRMNEAGAGEVVGGDGSSLMLIAKPMAVDAQGTGVPVTMTADGESIVLRLDHRNEDLAYPILVDPELLYQDWGWWYGNQHLSGLAAFGWAPTPSPWWIHQGTSSTAFPAYAGKGLFISTEPGSLGANQWGHYVYSAPNSNSYLADATVNPFWRENGACASPNPYYQPYDYVGMWNQGSWNRVLFNKANELGWANLESWGSSLMIGMSTNNGTSIPCWRHLMIGGVGIWLDDWQYPYLDSVGATPEGWVRKDETPRTFSVSASDAGLGVRTVRMFGVGTQKDWLWSKGWCAGTYEQRCLNSDSGQIAFRTDGFPYEGRYNQEGKEHKFTIQVIDPTDKRWQIERPLWLDGTPPTIGLEGQLASITGQEGTAEKEQAEGKDELSLPTYKLEVKADDGDDRSGVKEIKVFLDGKTTPEQVKAATSCTSGGCPRSETMTYTLQLPGLAPGKHSLRIVAVDLVGNESDPNRNIEFEYVPATGMKEEYVLQHFRLPDGNDYSGEAEYHGPEIAVNVINGNVVFHERDVDLETERGDLELERVYNSQQPTQKDTQWGRGWSIAQAPRLEPLPGSWPPQKATVVETGRITSSVPMPQSESQSTFSSKLHATITKRGTGYEVEPASASEVAVFSSLGRIEEVVQGDNSPAYLAPEEAEEAPSTPPVHNSSFGSVGAGNGQFKHPAGIAVDAAGDLWIVDQDNDRLQKFSAAGAYLASFGSSGTGNGQFSRPTDVAIDAAGNLWVTDAGANRVQKFNSKGEFLAKYGSYGTGNGQFNGPESIAIAPSGAIWVADTYNGRLQRFTVAFTFVKAVGSKGSGQGQLLEPTGIDVGPNGDVWVAEWGNNRVSVFDEAGAFVRQLGSSGAGNGQFARPDAIEVDHKSRVWVGDQNNGRVQQFDQSGAYVTQFGVKGGGPGQFSFGWPMGIATDSRGRLWISDTGNNRVQRWDMAGFLAGGPAPYFDAPVVDYEYAEGKLTGLQLEDEATKGEDPALEMSLSSGLVTAVDSEEGGDTSYAYASGQLTTVGGEDGQTKYAYDSSGRLGSVTLPNGTTATILYDGTSRATSVEVDPAGPEVAKKTSFSYSAEPRRTTVFGGGNPEIVYDIGEDGSVLKWAYAETPPTIPSISGSLWSKQGQEIENSDHTLFVTGSSPHQIASIKVVANGNSVVAEKTCKDPAEPPSHICEQWKLEWITHPSEHAPGRMDLEVIVTDFLGHQTAERFFVVVPQQPPPGPEEVERPSFASIKLFREENGLDRNKSLTESQLNELILELLYEWEKQDFAAMTAVENFGVPMRGPELEEMEWRRTYTNRAADVIPEWAEEHAPNTYGGFYVDGRAGGLIYVGFTANQQTTVEALRQDPRLLAAGQIREFPTPPVNSVASLEAMVSTVTDALANEPSTQHVSSAYVVPDGNIIKVGTTEPGVVANFLASRFGANAPVSVYYQNPYISGDSRYESSGPVVAGAALVDDDRFGCTAGFGAKAPAGQQRGQTQDLYFTLTAGHCYSFDERVKRRTEKGKVTGVPIGFVKRREYSDPHLIDGEGILIEKSMRSHSVLNGSPLEAEPIQGAQRARVGKEVCWSGVVSGRDCGKVWFYTPGEFDDGTEKDVYVAVGISFKGDSGGPVWDPNTHKAVGLITGATGGGGGKCWEISSGAVGCNRMAFTPLLQGGGSPGILPVLGLEILEQD
jgi:YD repeat-containing protein